MRATFTGDPNHPEETRGIEMFGVVFPHGEPVDVSHLSDVQKRKLAGNRHFTTDAVEPAVSAVTKKGRKG